MADKSLRYVVSAIDKGAGKTIGDVATHGSKAASTIGGAFGKLSGLLGGEVGELASKLQEHFDELGEHGGHGLAAKLEVGGAAMLGIGTALSAMGAAEKQSTDQLEQAVTNTGHSFEEVSGKVEDAVGHMEKYGFTAIQTKDALTSLTNATHDPQQALGLMGEAADLAASRHMTLNAAADMLAKTVNGSTRLYKLYGIQVKTNADGTKDLTGAQAQLAALLHGQADAAANNFTGRLKKLRAEVEDNVAAFGEKYGPAIMAAGGAMTLLTPIAKGVGSGLSKLAGIFKSTSDVGIVADEAAAASTGELSDAVAASTASQSGSFATVGAGAQTASATAISADEEAEASTTKLATAVQASAGVQTRAFAEVATAAEATATTIVAADQEMVAANGEVAASSQAVGRGSGAAKMGLMAAAGPTLGLAAGIAAVGYAGFKLSDWLQRGRVDISSMGASFEDLRTQVIGGAGSFDDLAAEMVKQQLAADGFAKRASAAGISVEDLAKGVTGTDDQFRHLIDTWQKMGNPSDSTIFGLVRMHQSLQATKQETEKLTASEHKQTEALDPLASKLGLTNSALKTAQLAASKTAASNRANTLQMQLENNAAGLLSASLDRLNGRTLNVEQANIAFRNSEHSVSEAVKQNGKSLSDNTQKGRNNRSAILDSISAAQQHAQAIGKQTGSTKAATAAYRDDIEALRRHLEKLGLEPAAIQRIIDKYGRVPALKTTKLTVKDLASQKLSEIQSYLHGLALGVTVPVRVRRSGIGNEASPTKQTAGGSDFFAGGQTLIAEREPEIVDLPRGTKITPLSKIPRGHYEKPAAEMNWAPVLNVLSDIHRAILAGQNISLDGYALETAMGRRADRYGRGGA